MIQHGPHRPAGDQIGTVAVQAVLADVEVEGREVHGAEIMERREQAVEVVIRDALADDAVQFGQAVQDPALQLRHFGNVDPLLFREVRECAQQVAERVAQAPVEVGLDFRISGPMRRSSE